jgi:pre-mRNA-splicing factor ATP-dependent RNA helicase DHX38/PRP16
MSEDTFVHDIAVDISRALNLTNPNDLIAKKVIQFAETNKDFEKFSKGIAKKIYSAWPY